MHWLIKNEKISKDIFEYVKNSQEKRFHFPDWMLNQIYYYLNLIMDNSKVVEKLGTNGIIIKHIVPLDLGV